MSGKAKVVLSAAIIVLLLLSAENPTAKTRSFLMGFTPFPYDVDIPARENTYTLLGKHSDIVVHHFDNGIPWPEAFAKKEYHPNVLWDLNFRISHKLDSQKLYLAVTPINNMREELAGYRGEESNMERPGKWKSLDFDSPKIIKAYINHCQFMIDFFQPDYFAYGVEVNLFAAINPEAFKKFVVLARRTYKALKKKYPELPIFLTFTIGKQDEFEQRKGYIKQLLPYTDYMAISTYPFLSGGGSGNPKAMAKDWFTRIADLAPDKPFAVAETGYIAETLVLETYDVTIPGKQKWQNQYLKRLFREANKLDAEFIVWFVIVDYDKVWIIMEQLGALELFKAWRDTGLINEKLKPRKSLKTWDNWLKRTVQ